MTINFKFVMNQQSGYIALTTVLIILAVVLITSMAVTFSSIGEAQSGLALFKGEENLQLVEGCLENVILGVKNSSTFSDTTVTLPEGSCTVTYNLSGPTNWDVTVTPQTTDYSRSIRAVFSRSSTSITLTSWNEI